MAFSDCEHYNLDITILDSSSPKHPYISITGTVNLCWGFDTYAENFVHVYLFFFFLKPIQSQLRLMFVQARLGTGGVGQGREAEKGTGRGGRYLCTREAALNVNGDEGRLWADLNGGRRAGRQVRRRVKTARRGRVQEEAATDGRRRRRQRSLFLERGTSFIYRSTKKTKGLVIWFCRAF